MINLEQTIRQLQDYLANNELDLALNKLRSVFSISNSELVNDAIILTAQLKKLKSDTRKGIIDYAQETLRYNIIVNSVLSMIDEIKNEPERFGEYDKTLNQLDTSIKDKGRGELPLWIKDALFERIGYVKGKGIALKAIWVDDFPSNVFFESRILRSFGVTIDFATSSAEAEHMLAKDTYDMVLSDVTRDEKPEEGLIFHRKLLMQGIDLPIIFYTGYIDRAKGTPPFAFGIADMPNDLIHLVLDVIERKY